MTKPIDTASRRRALVDELKRQGALRSPHWISAFVAVAREQFVDTFTVPSSDGLKTYDLAVPEQVSTALDAIYSTSSLLTQFDAGGTATSSSTDPVLMALMLEQLDAHPGHAVMEVGTGTGYNAALLAHALGNERVFTIDIDPTLTEAASTAVRATGHAPTVVTGDGTQGIPEHTPYDRVIVTCGMDRVPTAWIDQTRPGGILLVNLGFALARLTVTDTGTACGPFTDPAAFMLRRTSTRDRNTTAADVLTATDSPGYDRHTVNVATLDEPVLVSLRSLLLPSLRIVNSSTGHRRLYDVHSGAWCRVSTPENDRVSVTADTDAGHDLWTQLIQLADLWATHGTPSINRFGLTVASDGTHQLWLDTPETIVTTLP